MIATGPRVSVLVLHRDEAERSRLAQALRERGLEVAEAKDVDDALDAADRARVMVVLAQPEILLDEAMDIGTRIGVRSGANPKVVALTHLADPARKKAFAVHEAALLARPVDDLDALAATSTALAAVAAMPAKPDPSLGKMKVERIALAPEENLDAPARADGTPPVAIVVDDDELARGMIRDILAPRGYRVEVFSSAGGALRFVQKNADVSIILCDLNLPQMDGLELKQSLPESAAKIPFLLVTGESSTEHEAVAKKLGILTVVHKPLQARALCRLVRDAVIAAKLRT